MELLIVRHAIALEREEWAAEGRPDHERPLTQKGRKRMKRVSRGLRAIHPELELIATSPLIRAADTAEILAQAYGGTPIVTLDALAPGGGPERVGEWLDRMPATHVALVGHEPDLGRLVSWLLFGHGEPPQELRKGGACSIRFEEQPRPRQGRLQWFLTPRILRRLAE